jgi:hypothetical protein
MPTMTYTNTNYLLKEEKQKLLKRIHTLLDERIEWLKYRLGETTETERILQKQEITYGAIQEINIFPAPEVTLPFPQDLIPFTQTEYKIKLENGEDITIKTHNTKINDIYKEGERVRVSRDFYKVTRKDYTDSNFKEKKVIDNSLEEKVQMYKN